MFARTATRALFRATPSTRVGLAPRLGMQQRGVASTAPPAKNSVVVKFLKDMPVDVYPLAFLVTCVVSASIFSEWWADQIASLVQSLTAVVGYHLKTDKQLRLLPNRARS